MKWRVYLSSVLVVFLSLCFGSFIINQRNEVHAVSDISVTYNSGYVTSSYTDIFPTCTGSCFHDYSYIVVKISNKSDLGFSPDSNVSGVAFRLYGRADGSVQRTWYFSLFTPEQIYPISFSDSPYNYLQWGNGTNLSGDVTFILTNSPYGSAPSGSITLTENGTFDVTNYAEAVVDVPMEVVPGDYHDDLVTINQSILVVSATALVLYFLYAIYKMLLGGKTL